ncbi:glycoside hydrolase family 28 protein [Devosia sp.]|uniref:polygalacturonase PglB n=1 Tax=Devosia sp. TaxID=1871048 RepID=UPI003264F524
MSLITATEALATATIQSAIDAAAAAGGGRVTLAEGEHNTGGLVLRSGVELHLAAGAVLKPVPDYDAYAGNISGVIAEGSDRAILYAKGATNIAITGPGRIFAPGQAYIVGEDSSVGTFTPAQHRPRVLVFENCRDVRLDGITIEDSPMWTLHLVACKTVSVTRVTVINNERLPNTDGLVIDSCSDVIVENVSIATADDGVCLKTSRQGDTIGVCRNITVRNCQVASQSCALKLGTESFGDFDNVVFEDCQVLRSNRALGIFSRDGGAITNVRFSRISLDCHETADGFWGSGEALTITLADRRADRPAGSISGIVFEDITGSMEGALNIVSTGQAQISDVRLSRIEIFQRPGKLGTGRYCDMRPTAADLAPAGHLAGRANAWIRGQDGAIIGLVPYPGGMPGLYAPGISDLQLLGVEIHRPKQLPEGWNDAVIIVD